MSRHKSRRSKLANYQELRYLAQNEAASCTLNLQLQTLTQSGLDQVIKRAFEASNGKDGAK
jgi:ribosomal protein L28